MRKIADDLKIQFNHKTQLIPIKNGVDYLGWHFTLLNNGRVLRRLRASSKRRLFKKVKRLKADYDAGKIDLKQVTWILGNMTIKIVL